MSATKKAVGHKGFHLQAEEVFVGAYFRSVERLLGSQRVEAHTLFGSVGIEGGVNMELVVMGKEGVEIGKMCVFSMLLDPEGGELRDEAFAAASLVVLGGRGCVERDEDIGRDAASAIDCAASGGLVFQRISEMDGVG